jgi:hypothetical protein
MSSTTPLIRVVGGERPVDTRLPPPFLLFASMAADETGAVACAFWRRGHPPHMPALTLMDLAASSVADLDQWLPAQAAHLAEIARDLAPPPVPRPRRFVMAWPPPAQPPTPIYAPAAISTALIMRGIDCSPVPEKMELLDPAQRALKAAVFMTSGAVHFSPAADEKVRRHPYNAVRHRAIDRPPSAVAEAFALGVLLGLAPGF